MVNDENSDDETNVGGLSRRHLLGMAGASSLALLAGCAQREGSGIDISEDGTIKASGVTTLDLGQGVTVTGNRDRSVTLSASFAEEGGNTSVGSLTADSLKLGTNNTIVFGDEEQISAAYDNSTGRLEVQGAVQFSDGTLKGPYDTNNYVHDMLLPGMHPHATDAVGAQDNVLGYADRWANVTHTPFSDGGSLAKVFQPDPSGWAGWNRFEDFPARITIEEVPEDWAPGRAMVIFRDGTEAGQIILETRSKNGPWEQVAEKTENSEVVLVLNPDGASTPVTAIRWTFAEPVSDDTVRIDKLFYYSMATKGNTWLPKAGGETTGLTFLPDSEPDSPDVGTTLYTDQASGELRAKRADGTQLTLDSGSPSIVQSGTVTLSGGSAIVDTGITDVGKHLNVSLDPTGRGTNDSTVSVTSSVRWDDSSSEYRIEIRERETDVGNPTISYRITIDEPSHVLR